MSKFGALFQLVVTFVLNHFTIQLCSRNVCRLPIANTCYFGAGHFGFTIWDFRTLLRLFAGPPLNYVCDAKRMT